MSSQFVAAISCSGHYYDTDDGRIEGLSLVDIYTEQGSPRLISNIVIQNDRMELPIVGFENHGGRTYINDNEPLGKVLFGYGNNGDDGMEGVRYKNVIGTYLHGPLLPKNPQVCDLLLSNALMRKYGTAELVPLDDTQELEAQPVYCGAVYTGQIRSGRCVAFPAQENEKI